LAGLVAPHLQRAAHLRAFVSSSPRGWRCRLDQGLIHYLRDLRSTSDCPTVDVILTTIATISGAAP
jgi:hypothetical protein